LLMNIQELATAVEQGVNVKVVLLNNNALGLVHQQQDLFYEKRLFASKYQIDVDFVKIAEGFGAKTTCLGKSKEPMKDLKSALLEDGVGLIHAPIDVWERVYPMVPPGAANRTMIGADVAEVDSM
jgi:acetolactate synthase I/II/III large subunit